MNPLFWLVRMRRWAQHPPSWKQVRLVAAVVALCLLLVAIETLVGWPDWMTLERGTLRPYR